MDKNEKQTKKCIEKNDNSGTVKMLEGFGLNEKCRRM